MPTVKRSLLATGAGGGLGALSALASGGAVLPLSLVGGGLQLFSALLAPDREVGNQRNPQTRLSLSGGPAQWVLGRTRTPGKRIYAERRGDSLHLAIVLSEGACEGIEKVWADDQPIVMDKSSTDSRKLEKKSGPGGDINIWQYMDALRSGANGGESLRLVSQPHDIAGRGTVHWTQEHRLNGVSWAHIELSGSAWQRFPKLEFLFKGMKIQLPGQSEAVWTDSAAAAWYWLLTERLRVPHSDIDGDSVLRAHAVCTEPLFYTLPGVLDGYQTDSLRYTVNGPVYSDDDLDRVQQEFNRAWFGNVAFNDSSHIFLPGARRDVKWRVGEEDLVEEPQTQLFTSLDEAVDGVRLNLAQCRDTEYKKLTMPPARRYTNPAEYEDIHEAGVAAYVTDPLHAGRLAHMMLQRLRNGKQHIVRIHPGEKMRREGIWPGDVVALTLPKQRAYGGRYIAESVDTRDGIIEMVLVADVAYGNKTVLPPARRGSLTPGGTPPPPPPQPPILI